MLKPFHKKIQELAFVYAHCGLKPDRHNRTYSIAAVIIDMDQSKKAFESLVRYGLLTGREKYYSNVSKEMLHQAPYPEEVRINLRNFLKDQKFIFALDNHNTLDDLQKFCGDIRILDLSFATEFFLPHIESFTPKRLSEHVSKKSREKISFTAAEIVELSVELVRHICGDTLNDQLHPRAAAIRYYLQRSNTLFGEAFIHITQNFQEYFGGLFHPYMERDTGKWKSFLERAERPSRKKKKTAAHKAISLENLDELYQGMARAGKGCLFRPEQVEYARGVAAALNDTAILTIEAGTGTGKTQGYLIPVMEFLHRNKEARVVVSTYTKSLQEQIFQREIAFTKEIFKHYQDIPTALLKGKSSYICAEKLDSVYDPALEKEKLLIWLYFLNLIFLFRHADGDTAGEKIKRHLKTDFFFHQMQNEISARDGCKTRHTRCPAQVVTAEAASARLVITNHHKLALLDNDTLLSRLFRNYVIDEANHFENAVRSAYGQEFSSYELGGIIRNIEPPVKRAMHKAAGDLAGEMKKALTEMETLRRLLMEARHALIAMNPKIRPGQVNELQPDHPGFKSNHIKEYMNLLRDALVGIGRNLKFIRDPDLCRMLKIHARTAQRIKTAIGQLDDFVGSLQIIKDSLLAQDKVTAYQCFSKNWTLTAQSVDVADLIRNHIYAEKYRVIYTAATLCHRGSFESFQRITGMDRPFVIEGQPYPREFRFKMIPSPFATDAMEIIIPRKAASGKFDNKEAWINAVSAMIPDLVERNKGRTLVLFSSYSDLERIAEELRESLTTYPLLVQQQGSPTMNLCEEFREIKESVLLGVDTFWYGVDFKGDTLTQVIITRIPYPMPADPIQMARRNIMPPKAYWNRYYYDTEIKMRQGIGRLIRCDTDRGRVVILDSRYRAKG